ncbi:hypothetical protein PVAND_017295 [Polypedilum vanderplanki]|uniref:Uncharacterized protein n=1 Tax=Polypedilum vanderplanki TaxID=319348 RepID=A0A9J6BIA6_POLVA|nr:hypothetical protein PVAND_017295 [Polypedilum vanderplanki]
MKILLLLLFFIFDVGKSFTIDCNYYTWNHDVVGDLYQCGTTNIPISLGNIVTNVTGTHLIGKSNRDVEAIYILGNWILSFVPKDFSYFFPNIKAINIYHTTIERLYGDEFNEFPQLEYLTIINSNLTTISSKIFERTPNIKNVRFRNGMLNRVGYNIFSSIDVTQLQWVAFYNHRGISRDSGENQAAAIEIVKELREKCPFTDENLSITENSTCNNRRIEEFVCFACFVILFKLT